VARPGDLALDQVVVTYESGACAITALNSVTRHFKAGNVTLISGPSGSGKTTVLMVLAGLLRPTAGKVTVGGCEVYTLTDAERTNLRLRSIGFVFQQFYLFSSMTVVGNVATALSLRGLPWEAAVRRAEAELDVVGMSARKDQYPQSLSGGEQQRTAIARATVTRPQVLAADEPTAALDWSTGAQVMRLLRHAALTYGTTVLVVSHDPRAADYVDDCVQMQDGHFV
jgi:putative ABC transport system ATP-binding protein